jgi:hypothetical protein
MPHRDPRHALAERVQSVRREIFGECGGPVLARKLKLPYRTWMRYEAGTMMPAEILLRFLRLTNAHPYWLLTGRGPKYRTGKPTD